MFTDDGRDTLTFHPLPPPSDEDVLWVATCTARRVLAKISAMDDALDDDDDENSALSAALMDAVSPPSTSRLSRLLRAGDATFEHPTHRSQRCAMVEGYSVHANVAVKAEDRAGLERICRYGLRSPGQGDATPRTQRHPSARNAPKTTVSSPLVRVHANLPP